MGLQIPELDNLANSAFSTLAQAILGTDLTVSLTPGNGALFPVPIAPRVVPITVVDVTDTRPDRFEHMLAIAQAGSPDVFTVLRGQGGTLARPFPASAIVCLRNRQDVMDMLLQLPTASRTYTAAQDLNAEDCVNIGADGMARLIQQALTAAQTFSYINVPNYICACALDSQHVVICYQDTTLAVGRAIVANIQGGQVTFGQPVTFSGANNVNYVSCCALDSGRVLVFFEDTGVALPKAVVLAVSAMTINVPLAAVVAWVGAVAQGWLSCCTVDSSRVFLASINGTPNVTCSVITIAGNAITPGSGSTLVSGVGGDNTRSVALDQNRVLMVFHDTTNSLSRGVVVTLAGTVPTVGALVTLTAAGTTNAITYNVVAPDPNHAFVALGNVAPNLYVLGLSIQGTTIVLGASVLIPGGVFTSFLGSLVLAGPGSSTLMLVYRDNTATLIKAAPITFAGVTPILGTPVVLSGADNGSFVWATWLDNGQVVALWQDITVAPNVGRIFPLPCGDLVGQVDGLAQTNIGDGETGLLDFRGDLHLSSGRTIGERYWPGDGTGLTLSRRFYPKPPLAANPLLLGDTPAAFAAAVDVLKLDGRYRAP